MPPTLYVYPGPADRRYTDPLALPLFTDQRPPRGVAGRVDWRRSGVLSQWLEEHPLRESDFHLLHHPQRAFPLLLIRPSGLFEELSSHRTSTIISELITAAARAGLGRFSLALLDLIPEETAVRDFAEDVFEGLQEGLRGPRAGQVEMIRLFWRESDAEPLLRELRRFRHRLEEADRWEILLESDEDERKENRGGA